MRDISAVGTGRIWTALRPSSWSGWSIAALVALGVVLRFVWAFAHPVAPVSDFSIYDTLAHVFAANGNYGQTPSAAEAYWPPGWPLLLGVAYKIFGTHAAVAHGLIALLSGAALAGTALLAVRLLPAGLAIGGTAVAALNPGWIFLTSLYANEHLAAVLVVLILIGTTLGSSGSAKWALVLGMAEGALVLTRGDVAYVMIPALLFFLLRERRWRMPLMAIVGVLLILGPWTIRNATTFHEFIPNSSNGGLSFYRGTLAVRDAEIADPDVPPAGLTPHETDSFYLRRARMRIAADPARWLGYDARRFSIQWWRDDWILNWVHGRGIHTTLMSTTLNLVWRILLILAAVALLGLAFLRIPLASRWFPIASTSLLAVPLTVIAVGEGRRHVAVALGVVVLAGLGADLVSRAVRARGLPFPLRGRPSPSRRGLIASLAVAVAVLVPIGIVFAHDRPKGQDLLAQSDLQTVVSAIEACHSGPPAATYDRCAGLLHPKNVQLGPGRPAVQVTAAASRYVVVARSGSGNDFVFDKTGGKHCTVAGRALCPAGGNW